VLVDEKGDRVNSWTLRRHFYEALEAAGLGHLREGDPPLRWHDLRHTFASHAARVMRSLSDVQALCGHADIATTMRYVHYQPGAKDAELLAAAFAERDPIEAAVDAAVDPNSRIPALASATQSN
jgi:integrase